MNVHKPWNRKEINAPEESDIPKSLFQHLFDVFLILTPPTPFWFSVPLWLLFFPSACTILKSWILCTGSLGLYVQWKGSTLWNQHLHYKSMVNKMEWQWDSLNLQVLVLGGVKLCAGHNLVLEGDGTWAVQIQRNMVPSPSHCHELMRLRQWLEKQYP